MATEAAPSTIFETAEQTSQPELKLVVDNETGFDDSQNYEHKLAIVQFGGQVAIEALQAEYDAVTELAELIDGQMRAPIKLSFDGKDLYGPDGRSLTETAENGLSAAREQAKKNPNLWFEVGRRSLEKEEILEAVTMLKTGHANTMMLTTDFPAELWGAQEDVGGYNVTRKQALRRAITVNPDNGEIWLTSQTLDRSDPEALDAVDAEFGFHTNENGPRLGRRQFLTLTAKEQSVIMDRAVAAYDRAMTSQYGGEWYAGRRPADYRNTYNFAQQQYDLIDLYKKLRLEYGKQPIPGEIMYDMGATINARFNEHKNKVKFLSVIDASAPPAQRHMYDQHLLRHEMSLNGALARAEGRSFSACGSTWKPEGLDESTEAQLYNAGYGNRAQAESESEMPWHGGKIYKNAECVSCEEVKDEVGACRICKDCVENPKRHSKVRTIQDRVGDSRKAKDHEMSAKIFSFEEARRAKEKKKQKYVDQAE